MVKQPTKTYSISYFHDTHAEKTSRYVRRSLQISATRQYSYLNGPGQADHHGVSRRDALLAATLVLPTAAHIDAGRPAIASAAETPAADVFRAQAHTVMAVCTISQGGPQEFSVVASGIVWDILGHVVTAFSPVNTALRQKQAVVLAVVSERSGDIVLIPAVAVAREPSLNLIVLEADRSKLEVAMGDTLKPPPIASSASLRVGQDLFLISSTSQGSRSLSTGVLSSTGRSIPAPNGQQIRQALQTDVDITSLGLGGGLFDSGGNLVGVPTVSYTREGAGVSSGVNFALPSDVLLDAVPKLIAYGNLSGRR